MATQDFDLRERPRQPGLDDARFNQPPRNPNFVGGASPEAVAYQRSQDLRGMDVSERPWTRQDARTFSTAPAAAPAPAGGGLRAAGYAVGRGAAAAKDWAVGTRPAATTLAGAVYNRGAGALQAAGRVAGVATVGNTLRDNFNAMSALARDDEAGLSDKLAGGVEFVGNTVASGAGALSSKLPVIGPAISAALGSGAASNAIDYASPGASVLNRYGLQGGGPLRNALAPAASPEKVAEQPLTTAQPGSAPAATSAPTPPAVPAPSGSAAAPQAVAAAQPGGEVAPTPTNAVTRVGNSYSGSNVAGDITINGRAPGGGAISAQNMAAADALAGREQLRALGGAAPAPAPVSMAQAPTALHSGNSWQARNDLRNLEVSASSITNNGGRWDRTRGNNAAQAAYQGAVRADIAARNAQPALDMETIKSNNSLRDGLSRADAARYAADQGLRGDIFKATAGSRTAALQAAREERQAMRDERKYETERRDKALERLDKVFEAHATVDGKVDAGQLAELRNGAQAFLGSAIEAARKRGDESTAAALEKQGLGALAEDAQLMRRYVAGLKADRAVRSGWLPGERYVGTDNPGARTVQGVDEGLLFDTVRMSDGTTVNANRLRYRNGGLLSGLNPWADPTDEFAAIDPNGYLRKAPR